MTADRLLEVLGAFAEQTARAAMEVVVVLDGCRDGSADAIRGVGWPFALKVVEQPPTGVAAARNRGAAEAAHDLLVLLDDDLLPAAGLVAEHAAAARPATVTMGRHPPPEPDGALAAALRAWWEDHFRRKGQPGRPWSFLDFCSGNSAMSRRLLLDAGGFDERFKARGEDYELGIRLLERGIAFRYVAGALGEHRIDTDLKTTVAKTRAEGRNDVLIARRHPHVFNRLRLSRALGDVGLALSNPQAAENRLRGRMREARVCERLGLRRRWLAALEETLTLAFALGVQGEVASAPALERLAAAGRDGGAPARLSLDPGGGLDPLPSTGTSSVEVWRRGERLTEVRAVDGGEQWDNGVVAERVAAAVASVAGRELVAEILG
jgi:GT2 family glycosyltransferase